MARFNSVSRGSLKVEWADEDVYNYDCPVRLAHHMASFRLPFKTADYVVSDYVGRIDLVRQFGKGPNSRVNIHLKSVDWEGRLMQLIASVSSRTTWSYGFSLHVHRVGGALQIFLMQARVREGGCKYHYYEDLIGRVVAFPRLRWCWSNEDWYYSQYYKCKLRRIV